MEGVLGFTTPFAGNFAPKNWAFCQGQIMAISQNTALFSILGTTYGGNGTSTFALPDLRGRAVIGAGSGPGLTPYALGEVTGTEINTLSILQVPSHPHPVAITITPKAAAAPNSASPAGAVYATGTDTLYDFSTDTNLKTYQGALTTGPNAGSSLPFSILDPSLTLNYVICLAGIYPARN